MFGWSKWEKFRDRFRAAMAGNLTEQEMELALAWIKKGSIRSKEEFIKDIEWTMRNNWGSYTSKRFQENGQAMRFYTLCQKIKKDFVDSQ